MLSIEQLNNAAKQITLIISIICIISGGIGLFFNLIIFTRRSFRTNPCAIYFLAATCINLFVVFVIVPFRILVGVFSIDPTAYSVFFCKTQIFLFSVARALAVWFIVLACMDRYFSSSLNTKFRNLSSVKFARLAICICTIFLLIVYVHCPIYFNIGFTTDQSGRMIPSCSPMRGIYATFTPLWNLVWYALLPAFFMLFFGILTIMNIYRSRQQLAPQTQQNNTRINNQLLKMLLIQVIIVLVTSIPFIACRLQLSLTLTTVKSQYDVAQDNLFLQAATVVSLISNSISFYLFTLTGSVFRREFYRILSKWAPCLVRKNQVHPALDTIRTIIPQQRDHETVDKRLQKKNKM